ncbi:MAG: glycosyltransferase N-terminal domain-containing protein [Bacteroidota bacterium]
MLLYRLFTWLYPKLAWLLASANPKARKWVLGRSGLFAGLSAAFHKNTKPVIWMHCSSVGEFEQGLPVLENLKKQYPGHCLLLTFFSPSGYEVRKNYRGVDHVFYLPMDTPRHANRFMNIVQPSLILFVKYEFWFYYLQEAKERNIPLLLVSGIFREDQPFFKWYGTLHRKMLGYFTYLFVQNQASAELLEQLGYQANVLVCGDTRFDRVMTIAQTFEPIDIIDHFCKGETTIVAGSTWTDDDEELDHFANTHPAIRFIIAPHDIEEGRIKECLTLYKNAVLFSEYEKTVKAGNPLTDKHVLIIDNVGMLSRLYQYATICYIGGGFGDDGIHNILEAAVYGKPVVFGPEYDKYAEADELLDAGGAFTIDDALQLEALLEKLLTDFAMYDVAARAAAVYVKTKAGATGKVMTCIQEKRLLTN